MYEVTMNTNSDLPQVHTLGHLPPRSPLPASREAIEERIPNNEEEDKEATNKSEKESVPGDVAISDNQSVPNFDSEDEVVPNFESEDESEYLFENKTTRIGFIQKVLAVKLLQVLAMSLLMGIFVACGFGWRTDWFMNYTNILQLTVLSIFGFFVTNLMTFGVLFGRNTEKARRKSGFRYMFLVVYPLRLSALIIICSMYFQFLYAILLIFFYYCVVVLAMLVYSIFAYQTKLEFAAKYGVIVSVATQIIMCATTIPFLVAEDFFWYINHIYILCAAGLMILEYIYILYTIEIMTSRNYWKTAPRDFLDGVINLQTDYFHIINVFVVSKILDKSKMCMKKLDVAMEV